MKFICPECGLKEEVIGDPSPLCLVCRVEMLKPTPTYADLLLSPTTALRRLETVMRTHGFEAAKLGRYKQEREAWIAAVWSFGLHEITGREYWIEVETRESTPDCKVHFFDQIDGNNHLKTINVEIVEWDEHRDDVLELIVNKCARAYPEYFFLLVFARNGKTMDVVSVQSKLSSLKIPFAEIWTVGRLGNVGAQYAMLRLHPGQQLVEFDLVNVARKDSRTVEFLRKQRRGKGTEREDLGSIYLPIKNL